MYVVVDFLAVREHRAPNLAVKDGSEQELCRL
jgi:hypothetical protein